MKYIQLNNEIAIFRNHLDITPRVIFSAKFGDGKTTFLKEFRENEKNNDYVFFTIHPINYPVASNDDIFEYIKRDILLQLAETMVVASLSLKLPVMLNDSLLHLFRKASTLTYLSHPVVIFILSRFFGMECGVFLFVVTFAVSGLFAISINTLSYRFKLLKYLY